MRMAAALRRDIAYGHLPPCARIPQSEYAGRHHAGPSAANKAVTRDQPPARGLSRFIYAERRNCHHPRAQKAAPRASSRRSTRC
jgi:hypothetical protein